MLKQIFKKIKETHIRDLTQVSIIGIKDKDGKFFPMPKGDTQEQDIRVSMAIFFMMIAVMLYLHLEVALGAFIAGVFIATFFEHKEQLPH